MRSFSKNASTSPSRLVLLLVVLLSVSGAAVAADNVDYVGDWKGAINIQGTELGILVSLKLDESGALHGDVDIPMQGATDLPLSKFNLDGRTISFYLAVPGGAAFKGTLSDDGITIKGNFTQAGQSFPFSVERQGGTLETENQVAQTPNELEGFSEFIEQARQDWQVPGAAVAIIKDGEVIFAEGFGQRDVDKSLPVTADTQFGIGSSTKAFTALLAGMLADEGKLNLDKPLKDYIPGFAMEDQFATERITLRDFLTHC